jgi:hypothetical protein
MDIAIIFILDILLILVGIYKRKENYGGILIVIGMLFLLLTLYMAYGFGVVL